MSQNAECKMIWNESCMKIIVYLRKMLRPPKAPSDEGAVAKRLRERKCCVFSVVTKNAKRPLPQSASLTAPSAEGACGQ